MTKRPALGKGLSSLLPARENKETEQGPATATVTQLPATDVQLNPNQPRREFREQQLQELSDSIRHDGIIQPLIVRRIETGYQLVAGERRLRAARLAGLETVPVVVQDIADERLLEIALVENIQREDLNPIELAQAFDRLCTDLGLNHEEIGRRTGKDRVTITNTIRLLQLPAELQGLVADRKLSPGHARALLKLKDEDEQRKMALQAIAEGWTVRATETASQRGLGERSDSSLARQGLKPDPDDPNVKFATGEMERVLGTKVRILEAKGGKGKIEIEYYGVDDLNRLYSLITRQD